MERLRRSRSDHRRVRRRGAGARCRSETGVSLFHRGTVPAIETRSVSEALI
jgi:hypothetical protein